MKKTKNLLFILVLLSAASLLAKPEKDIKAISRKNIVVCGSSTVWGKGLLDYSFVAPVDAFMKNELSTTVLARKMTFKKKSNIIKAQIFKNKKQYQDDGYLIDGEGASVEFDISGDELAICQTVKRTTNWAKMNVYANGKFIVSFNNKNKTLGSAQNIFKGNGKIKNFELPRCFTYNHNVTINNKKIKGGLHIRGAYMTKDIFTYYPKDFEYIVIRKYSKGQKTKIIHSLLLKKTPPTNSVLKISYDYGQTICHTKCTIGESKDGKLESAFGAGRVAHDPAHPTRISTGLDYRYINPDAFFIHKFKSFAKRHIKIVIEGGENPYFIIDFATSRFHNLMNAGIGGWTANRLLNDRYLRNYKEACKAFKPDIFFIALGGNDDWKEKKRFCKRTIKKQTEAQLKNMPSLELHSAKFISDNNYTVVKNTGIIESITKKSLISSHLKGEKIKPGYFVRIGNYTGDNNSIAVRVIKTFDPKTGEITWGNPLRIKDIICVNKIEDLKGTEIAIRDLQFYGKNIRELVKRLKIINPEMAIVLLNVYNTNFFTRQIWGYPELQKIIALENKNVYTVNAAKTLQNWQMNKVSGKRFVEVKAGMNKKEHTLSWKGHWQGYKVWVNGKDVYGKDCYILSGCLWARNQKKKGKELEFTGDYKRGTYTKRNQKLIFFRNAPESGKIKVEKADTLWSSDFAHPSKYGIQVIGTECGKMIKQILKDSSKN